MGLTAEQMRALRDCLSLNVQLKVRNRTVDLQLDDLNARLLPALESAPARNTLLSSSDLSRTKVIRRDLKTGKKREWVLDCRPPAQPEPLHPASAGPSEMADRTRGFWLRDGDVIEVPERAAAGSW